MIQKSHDHQSQFPTEPNVYLMKDETGKVIYVGKALNLRKWEDHLDGKTVLRIRRIGNIETVITATESVSQKQVAVSPDFKDRDVIAADGKTDREVKISSQKPEADKEDKKDISFISAFLSDN